MTANLDTHDSSCVQNARSSFIASARCARSIVDATLNAVAAVNGRNESPAAHAGADWPLIARGIVRGAMDFGADLKAVGQGMMLGAIRDVKSEEPKLETIKVVAEIGLYETIALGGDFEAMACGMASGACEGGREKGEAEADVMTAAAEGASTGAHRSGYFVNQRVEEAIRRTAVPVAHASELLTPDMRD